MFHRQLALVHIEELWYQFLQSRLLDFRGLLACCDSFAVKRLQMQDRGHQRCWRLHLLLANLVDCFKSYGKLNLMRDRWQRPCWGLVQSYANLYLDYVMCASLQTS